MGEAGAWRGRSEELVSFTSVFSVPQTVPSSQKALSQCVWDEWMNEQMDLPPPAYVFEKVQGYRNHSKLRDVSPRAANYLVVSLLLNLNFPLFKMNRVLFSLIYQQLKHCIILKTTQFHIFFCPESINSTFPSVFQNKPAFCSLPDPQDFPETHRILFQVWPSS